MKHSLKMLAIAVLLVGKLFAQTDPVRTELNHIFQYIDKSQVPAGYLDEYGPQFAEKKWYNGVLTDSNIIAYFTGFRLLYNDIEEARIYTAAPTITPLTTVNTTVASIPVGNSTPLIFLAARYASLNEDAINLNLFSKYGSNQIVDVPGRKQSPYIQNSFFAACPTVSDAPQTNIMSLKFNPALQFTNCGKTISSVAVDFLDGNGYQTIAANAIVSKTYTDSSGIKKFAIKAVYTDGSINYCYSQQYVRVKQQGGYGARFSPLTGNELLNPAITIAAVSGQHYEAKVYIRYSQKRQGTALANTLVKPFIVVEGYDLHDAAPNLGSKENNSINTLIEEWNELLKQTSYDLSQQLDDVAGYDLVYVDYYTMDDIQNNALMLEKVIDQLNALKVNNAQGVREQNVVMGISLGGVLARYTLAKITKARGTTSTDTRLLLTYDSPHQGGNVPLGFQYFLQEFGELKIVGKKFKDVSDELKEFYNLNAQPATSQLLLNKVPNGGGAVEYNSFFAVGGPYRNMVDFTPAQEASTPPSYTFKAIAQGSQCGVQVMQPGTLLSQSSENVSTARFILMGLVVSKYKLSVQINALPAQGATGQICHVKMERNIRLFWGLIGTGWKSTHDERRYAPIGLVPWDGVPGGTSSATKRSGGSFGSTNQTPNVDISRNTFVGNFLRVLLYGIFINVNTDINIPFQQDVFTTVPINSALDIQNTTASTLTRTHIFPIDGRANSTSVNYIANEAFVGNNNGVVTTLYNYEHADFTKRQAQWMFNEMENRINNIGCTQISDCYSPTTQLSITQTGCNEAIVTAAAINASSYTWTVGGDLLINGTATTLTTTTNTISVTGTNGSAQVIAITPCGTIEAYAGYNPFQRIIQGNLYDYFPNEHLAFSVNTSPSDTYYKWYINGLLVLEGANEYYFCTCSNGIDNSHIGSNIVKVVIETTCNTSEVEAEYIRHASYGRAAPPNVEMYPNPTKDRTTIKLKEVNKKNASVQLTSIAAITVLDKFGNVRKFYKYPTNSKNVTLNITNLPFDIYIVEISDGKNKVRLQLRIE